MIRRFGAARVFRWAFLKEGFAYFIKIVPSYILQDYNLMSLSAQLITCSPNLSLTENIWGIMKLKKHDKWGLRWLSSLTSVQSKMATNWFQNYKMSVFISQMQAVH